MAKQKVKVIHLITMWGCRCKAVCDKWVPVEPIGSIIRVRPALSYLSKGTFNLSKVTCKRCLKHPKYKEAIDRVRYPLLFWKEGL